MKYLITLTLGILIMYGCSNNEGFTIKGTIEGAKDGTVYLKSFQNGKAISVDSTQLKNGKFKFTGKVEYPLLYLIYYDQTPVPIAFFAENKNITVDAQLDSLDKAVIKGSPSTDLFMEFSKNMPHLDRSMKIRQEFVQAQMAGDTAKMKELSVEANIIAQEQKKYFSDFVENNTNSPVGAFLGSQMAQSLSVDELKDLVGKYEADLGEHPYVDDMNTILISMEELEKLNKATAIGSEAPGFTLKTKDGKEVSLSSFRGKYVLIDFWASWCQPCRRENPNSLKAYNKYKNKGFEILGVSLDKDRNAWIKAVKDDGMSWIQVIDPDGEVANLYGVNSIPSTFLLNKKGEIVAKNLRGPALMNKLNELLNN